jgi:predicted Zn finger-like uncharacterized protein
VIVTCERCETQFQLDESRVPESGARVRCSRCKHAFMVHPPAGSEEEEIQQAVGQALDAGETPDVAQDLPDPSADRDPNDESDWQFNDDREAAADSVFDSDSDSVFDDSGSDFGVIGPDESLCLASEDDEPELDDGAVALPFETDDATPEAHSDVSIPPAGEPAIASDPVEREGSSAAPLANTGGAVDLSEELGSPDEWDIFDDPTGPSEAAAPPARKSIPAPAPTSTAGPTLAVRIEDPEKSGPVHATRTSNSGAGVWRDRAGTAAGWMVTVALCLFGLARGLAPPAEATLAGVVLAPGISLDEVDGRWVDNGRLGKLYVVSGRVRLEGAKAVPMPPLELVLRDASGRALEPTWRLASPRPEEALREGTADTLTALRAGFRRPLKPGEERAFEVVAWPLPREAERFEVRAEGGAS